MAEFTITWLPSTSPSVNQLVQYKKSTDTGWTTFSTVEETAVTANITGLSNNTIYNFRVTSTCDYGGSANSNTATLIEFGCPVITLTPSTTSIAYSFIHPGASITGFTVALFASDGTTLLETHSPSIGASVTGTFTGLTEATAYKVRLTLVAGAFSEACTMADTTTDVLVCADPTGVVATIA